MDEILQVTSTAVRLRRSGYSWWQQVGSPSRPTSLCSNSNSSSDLAFCRPLGRGFPGDIRSGMSQMIKMLTFLEHIWHSLAPFLELYAQTSGVFPPTQQDVASFNNEVYQHKACR